MGVYYEMSVGPSGATSYTIQCSAGITSATMSPSAPTAFAATPAGTAISTAGGALVQIAGTQFGPTDSIATATTFGIPYAYAGAAGNKSPGQNVATDCTVIVANTQITCRVPGAGAGNVWALTVNGLTSQSGPVLRRSAPRWSTRRVSSRP